MLAREARVSRSRSSSRSSLANSSSDAVSLSAGLQSRKVLSTCSKGEWHEAAHSSVSALPRTWNGDMCWREAFNLPSKRSNLANSSEMQSDVFGIGLGERLRSDPSSAGSGVRAGDGLVWLCMCPSARRPSIPSLPVALGPSAAAALCAAPCISIGCKGRKLWRSRLPSPSPPSPSPPLSCGAEAEGAGGSNSGFDSAA